MAAIKKDSFANVAAIAVSESAANTQTSAKFAFPFSIMDKMGIIISRVEYWLEGMSRLNSGDDRTIVGLSTAAAVTNLNNQSDPQIIDSVRFCRLDFGAAASGLFLEQPLIKDFSSLPGGGILCAPSPLYAIIQSVGASDYLSVWVKMFYTYMELKAEEYWQLVESRRIISD